MKVLIVGHSGTLGLLLPESERMPAQLATLLKDAFPEQDVEVRTEPWRHLTEDRLQSLMARLETYRPDYFLFDPVPFWVSFPIVNEDRINRVQRVAYRGLRRLRLFNRPFERWLLMSAPTPLIPLLDVALRWVECNLFAAKPLFTVPEAMAAMERLIGTAKRLESTEIVMLGSTPEGLREALAPPDSRRRYTLRRFFPRDRKHLAEGFVSELLGSCTRHHVTFVDTTSFEGQNLAADRFHRGADNALWKVTAVFEAIRRLESAYQTPRAVNVAGGSRSTGDRRT